MPNPTPSASDLLGRPALRRQLEDFVRRRVPRDEVDDVVQTVLCDALAAKGRPEGETDLAKWVIGIARHKVADLHRRARREPPSEAAEIEIETSPPPVEERELARWAEEQAGEGRDAKQTLTWMAREGEGEKLETIASEEAVPAARVRQRVSRMRRWMKERWLAELAAVAAFAVLAFIAWRLLRAPREEAPEAIRPDPVPPPTLQPEVPAPLERARGLRADALRHCSAGAWRPCLDGLDQAARLDPAGDADPAVAAARGLATDALRSAPNAPDTADGGVVPLPAPTTLPAPVLQSPTKGPPPGPKSSFRDGKKPSAKEASADEGPSPLEMVKSMKKSATPSSSTPGGAK